MSIMNMWIFNLKNVDETIAELKRTNEYSLDSISDTVVMKEMKI